MNEIEQTPPDVVPASGKGAAGDDRGEVVCVILADRADEAAARLAARLADRLSLRLALVRVQYLVAPPDAAFAGGPNPVMHPLAPVAPEPVLPHDPVTPIQPAETPAWEEELATSQRARRDSIAGPPGEALRALSDAADTRLVVAGDHGGGPLSSKLTGNTARDVVRDVRCPLVLVGPDHAESAGLKDIVCAVDENDEVAAAAELAADLADRLGAGLHVVHVTAHPIANDPPRRVALEDLDDNRRRSAVEAFKACRRALPATVVANFVAVEGDTADGLGFAAAQLGAGLIVIGRPSHASLGSALLGSAAHDLLGDGAVPVVIAPHAGAEAPRRWAGAPQDESS